MGLVNFQNNIHVFFLSALFYFKMRVWRFDFRKKIINKAFKTLNKVVDADALLKLLVQICWNLRQHRLSDSLCCLSCPASLSANHPADQLTGSTINGRVLTVNYQYSYAARQTARES